MTEAEWRTCGSRVHMRRMIVGRWPDLFRRWIFFNLACLRRVEDLLGEPRCRALMDLLESSSASANCQRLLSHHTECEDVRDTIRELMARLDDPFRLARVAACHGLLAAGDCTLATSEMVAVAVGRQAGNPRDERRAHCGLLRDIFGNPFRPVAFDPAWGTDTAVSLARLMYDLRDFGAMPILADALQDAGCEDEQILVHCRDANQVHVRGCWVVDLVLGKE